MDELHIMSKYSTASYGRLFLSVMERKPELMRMSEEQVTQRAPRGARPRRPPTIGGAAAPSDSGRLDRRPPLLVRVQP